MAAVAEPPRKTGAAALSVASNLALIVVKLVAGVLTGSVAILTEAVHSGIDLLASVIAYASLRKADQPADAEHPYGHEKLENVAAAAEGVLILAGATVIVYESIRHLVEGSHVHTLGVGIGVVAASAVTNVFVSRVIARRAVQTESPALEGDAAHLSTDAATSGAVLVGLVLVQVTGAQWLDPAVAIAVAVAIVASGVRLVSRSTRVLVDEALPPEEMRLVRDTVVELGADQGVVGLHQLRARRAGSRRYLDLHLQFRAGTTLEAAHGTAHMLQDEIGKRLGNADILIHLEPEDRVRPGSEIRPREEARGG
jgi:cation diffusion facilitator family transporter